jgi:DivIVA domain-containing protein
MEKDKMNITHQDIIDKEFRVKFRGFDIAEVDTFLEEVAENFFKLTEENTLLHEKMLAMRRDFEAAAASHVSFEFPPELSHLLDDLKQDTESVGQELASLKQDRQSLDSLKKGLEKIIISLEESGTATPVAQVGISADLAETLDGLKKDFTDIKGELATLKGERQSFDAMKESLEDALAAIHQETSHAAGRDLGAAPGDLGKTLEDFNKGNETVSADLAALKQEIAALSGVQSEIRNELRDMLAGHFAMLETKLPSAVDSSLPSEAESKAAPKKTEDLVAAKIIEEPESLVEEDTRVPESEEQDQEEDDNSVGLLSEDDILDVDKLRGLYQSILDDTISDAHTNREADDSSADLLFFDDDLIDDQNEPQVTFSLDENTKSDPKNFK